MDLFGSAASSAAAQAPGRRKSDLPAGLDQFDMLGLGSSPPVAAPASAYAAPAPTVQQQHLQQSQVSFPSQQMAADSFASFPAASNPVSMLSVPTTPVAATSSPVSASPGVKRNSAAGILPPPPTSTRHRKDSSAGGKRGSGSAQATPMSGADTPAASYPASSPHPADAGNNLLNLDFLSSGFAPQPFAAFANSGPVTMVSTPQQHQQAQPAMNLAPLPAANNPFAAFDSPPDHADPFAEFARQHNSSANGGSGF
jgi:hypothetical protein